MGLACISVDLDSLPHYCRIHGLPESILDEKARGLVYTTALERFLELVARLSMPATLFAIGQDLAHESAAAGLRKASELGLEVGNHSHAHDYALTQMPDVTIARDVERAGKAIAAAVGHRPVGFRAPGYTLNAALYQVLCDQGYRYDSSVFPAAPYYAAKAAMMGALAILGRPSRAILDTPKVLLAPREPYFPHPEDPYRRGPGSMVELPVATSPLARIPFIGTLVVTLPAGPVRTLYRSLRQSAFLNFELHAVDLLDQTDGIPAELTRQQRDLSLSREVKIERLSELFRMIKDDFELTTLADAAARLGGER